MAERWITAEALAVLKANMKLSPHAWAIVYNPAHAYLCDGSCNKGMPLPDKEGSD